MDVTRALFWDRTQCRVVVPYRGFRKNLSVPSSRTKQFKNIDLTHKRDRWRALTIVVMNLP